MKTNNNALSAHNNINSISELSNVLAAIPHNNDNKLEFLVQTELQVISSLGSAELGSYAMNNILDLLKENLDYSVDEKEKRFYQIQAISMIQALFLFSKVKIMVLEEEDQKAGNELFDKAISLVEKGIKSVFVLAKTTVETYSAGFGFTSALKKSAKSALLKTNKLNLEEPKGFFAKARAKKQADQALEDAEEEYEDLKEIFSRKGIKYRELFGDSITFKELLGDVYYAEGIYVERKKHIVRGIIFSLAYILFTYLMCVSFSNLKLEFLISLGVIIGINILLAITSISTWIIHLKSKRNVYNKLDELIENRIDSKKFLDYESKLKRINSKIYSLDSFYNVLCKIWIALAILLVGIGLAIFLWTIESSAVGMIFAKIFAVIFGLITLIIEIIKIRKLKYEY
ncbi:MAG: hypothetical protein MJ211_16265 [Bacteroidales bacterium]|nr:hypothetical protein [Bacteroidales bacterium]